MAIPFKRIPSNLRVPGVYTEFDNSNATRTSGLIQYKRLLIGTMLATGGAATPGVPQMILNTATGVQQFGAGSVLDGMIRAALAQDPYTELWALPLADPSAGAAATATLTVAGTATAAGTLALYVCGRLVQVAVGATDTAAAVATKIAAAINGYSDTTLPVTAAAAAAVVTLTARNKGETGNTLDVRTSYYGESLPAGQTFTATAFTGGSGNPSISAGLANMEGMWLQAWACAYTDTANLVILENEMYNRWGPLVAQEGHVFGAVKGTVAALSTLGSGRNSESLTLVEAIAEPMPAYEKAAETMALWVQSVANDPARPVQHLPYIWCLPPQEPDQLTVTEKNVLLFDGIATTYRSAGGQLMAERLITTYQTNSAGGTDASYLDSETRATLLYARHNLEDRIRRKYPQSKLADDGNLFGPGQDIVTPSTFKAELVAWAIEQVTLGIFENIETFKALTFSERDLNDRNRLNSVIVPDLVNGLRIVGTKIQFIL